MAESKHTLGVERCVYCGGRVRRVQEPACCVAIVKASSEPWDRLVRERVSEERARAAIAKAEGR